MVNLDEEISELPLGAETMFDALVEFLNREGDKHFDPDYFDQLHAKWLSGEKLNGFECEELVNLYQQWAKQ